MNTWVVKPLKSVNDIEFGMKREQVRNIFGDKYREFNKTKFSNNTTDDFYYYHVFYNEKDECEAVEIFEDISVIINGLKVFPNEVSVLTSIASDFTEENGSYISKSMSIGVYAPNGKIESILFGVDGYYIGSESI